MTPDMAKKRADPESRPAIPADLRRRVLVEAGHRCAIPTCRTTTTEIAHIVPWSKCREHRFENLVALCPNCHARFHKGEIDKKSMLIYKVNLGLVNSRYSDFERRVLHLLIDSAATEISLPAGYEPLLYYLIRDGMLSPPVPDRSVGGMFSGDQVLAGRAIYRLTELGQQFLVDYRSAQELE